MLWILLFIVLPFVGVMAFFVRRQERMNRAMDALDDSRQEAGYVGPNLPPPY